MEATDREPTETEPRRSERKGKNTALSGCLIVLALIVIIVALLFWLRECGTNRGLGEDSTKKQSSADGARSLAIENKVHSVLHTESLGKDKPLCSVIHIIEAKERDGVVGVIIRLTAAADAKHAASVSQSAVMDGVPEVSTVSVVDASGSLIGTPLKRK